MTSTLCYDLKSNRWDYSFFVTLNERGKLMIDFQHDTPFYRQKNGGEAPIDQTKTISQVQPNQFKRAWEPVFQGRKVEKPAAFAEQMQKLTQKPLSFAFEHIELDEED